MWHSRLSLFAGIPYQCVGLSLAALLPIKLSANALGKAAGDGLKTWAPVTHEGDSDRVPGSWLWPGPALAVEPFGE